MFYKNFILSIAVLFACAPVKAGDAVTTKNPEQTRPFSFIENKGQITDQDKKIRTDIQYKLSGKGITVFIGNGQLHYEWTNPSMPSQENKESITENPFTLPSEKTSDIYRMDVTLLGANILAIAMPEQGQQYYERYFAAGLDQYGVIAHTYNKITYKNVYPNIDWVLYIKDNKLEYDFIVHPGGNAKNIRLKYEGATSLSLSANGSITAATPMGSVSEQKPFCYSRENKAAVLSSYKLNDNILSFNISNYTGTLVIDPTLAWATYFGGFAQEIGQGVACDTSGNVYMTGVANSTSNIATSGSYQDTFLSATTAFLAKFDKNGSLLWSTYYYGSSPNTHGVACDQAGNVYLTGEVNVTGIATSGSYQSVYGGQTDAFLAKFSSSGSLAWATYFGGAHMDAGVSVACDPSGNVIISGFSASSTGIATSGAYQSSYITANYNPFLAKFNAAGMLQWGTYFGNTSFMLPGQNSAKVICNASGDIYFTSFNNNANLATAGAHQITINGGTDACLAKFNGSGSLQWCTYYGGSRNDNGYALALDKWGNIYLGGVTSSTNNIASSSAYQTTILDTLDQYAFLAKFDSAGTFNWGTYYGQSGNPATLPFNATCDTSGNIFLVGYTVSPSNVVTPDAYQPTIGSSGIYDGIMLEFDSSGQHLLYGTYYGGTSPDYFTDIVCDTRSNDLYTAGWTYSSSHIATPGSYQSSFGGTQDAFLAKWGSSFYVIPPIDTLLCAGDTCHVAYSFKGLSFNQGNVFTVQLSDSSGSFANPVAIGHIMSTVSDTVLCHLPVNLTGGIHYRTRVVSSDPIDNSAADTLNLHIKPAPSVTVQSNSPVCVGTTLAFTITTIDTGLVYLWAGPAGFNSTQQNPSIANASPGYSGPYTVAVTSLNGCSINDSIQVVVDSSRPVSAQITAMPGDTICSGSTTGISFTCSTTNGGSNPAYQWRKNGIAIPGAISDTYTTFNLLDNDTISCIVYGSSTCQALDSGLSNLILLHVIASVPAPALSFSVDPPVITSGQTTTLSVIGNETIGLLYQWRKNGIDIPGATGSTYISADLNEGDQICLFVRDTLPCVNPDTILVCGNLGVEQTKNLSNNVIIYPNPNNGNFIIEAASEKGDLILQLFNTLGQLAYTERIAAPNRKIHKEIKVNLPAAIYIMQLTDADGNINMKQLVIDK